MRAMREIEEIICSCIGGRRAILGTVKQVETTFAEEEKYGCGQKGCCVRAYECKECKTRWVFSLFAPDIA